MDTLKHLTELNLISFDGGAIKGVGEASLINEIEKMIQVSITDHFQMLTGTSTGSIIAALLSLGYTPQQIVDLYVKHGAKIFDKKWYRFGGMFGAKYSDKYLNKVLKEYLGDKKLKDIKGHYLMIPAFNSSTQELICFANYKPEHQEVLLYDIVRASASAQSYFKPHFFGGSYYIDGGNVLNNPSIEAYEDVRDPQYMNCDKVNVLSISGGTKEAPLSDKQTKWGLIKWAKVSVETILREQAQRVDAVMRRKYSRHPELGKYRRIHLNLIHASDALDLVTSANLQNLIIDGRYSAEVARDTLEDFFAK